MKLVLCIILAASCAFGQSANSTFTPVSVDPPITAGIRTIRAGCTPVSMSAARAGALTAEELGRWECYAQNLGSTPQPMSYVGFSLDFIELHQVGPADVTDIFETKQKMSNPGKWARGAEVVGVIVGVTAGLGGIGGIKLGVQAVTAIAAGTYGAGKLGDYFNRRIPPSANAVANQWGPVDTVVLAPGQGIRWKVYASKMHGATGIGPRWLMTLPGQ